MTREQAMQQQQEVSFQFWQLCQFSLWGVRCKPTRPSRHEQRVWITMTCQHYTSRMKSAAAVMQHEVKLCMHMKIKSEVVGCSVVCSCRKHPQQR